MRLRSGPAGILGLLLIWSASAMTADSPTLERGAALAAASGPRVDAVLADIGAAAKAGSASKLVGIAATIASFDLHPAARERLLRELALALASTAPNAESRDLIDQLARHAPGVRVWLHEGPHRIDVPLFDVAAAARYARRRWAEAAAHHDALIALQAADLTMLERFGTGDEAFRNGVVAALDEMANHRLLAWRDPILDALRNDSRAGRLALPLVLRFADVELAETLLRQGDAALLVHALPRIVAAMPETRQLELLQSALGRPELASAAMFQIGRLAVREERALELLLESIGDPASGGSAAAALASLDDPEVARRLGRKLEGGGSGLAERRALLALRLSGTPAAHESLERFMRSDTASGQLKNEARAWLER